MRPKDTFSFAAPKMDTPSRGIANIFNQMGLVEAWGTGIRRIIHLAGEYALPAPAILAFDSMFRVNLYRSNSLSAGDNDSMKLREDMVRFGRNIGGASEKHRRNIGEASEKYRGSIGESLC